MLEHSGEALAVFVGFWRFVLSGMYRHKKIEEWRELRQSLGGRSVIAVEIGAALVFGLRLPIAIIVVVAAAL